MIRLNVTDTKALQTQRKTMNRMGLSSPEPGRVLNL
jgi:hypothetical protein